MDRDLTSGSYWDVLEAAWRTWSPAEPAPNVVPDIPQQVTPEPVESDLHVPAGVGHPER